MGIFTIETGLALQAVAFIFAAGKFFADQKATDRRLEELRDEKRERAAQVDTRFNRVEERLVTAVEKLGTGLANLTAELKEVLATHETRIQHHDEELRDLKRR